MIETRGYVLGIDQVLHGHSDTPQKNPPSPLWCVMPCDTYGLVSDQPCNPSMPISLGLGVAQWTRRAARQHAMNEPVLHSELVTKHQAEMGPERQ